MGIALFIAWGPFLQPIPNLVITVVALAMAICLGALLSPVWRKQLLHAFGAAVLLDLLWYVLAGMLVRAFGYGWMPGIWVRLGLSVALDVFGLVAIGYLRRPAPTCPHCGGAIALDKPICRHCGRETRRPPF